MPKTKTAARLSIVEQRRAREYEMIYILRASIDPDEADRINARFNETIDSLKGKLIKLNNWGRRRLAYPIKNETRGVFVYTRFLGYDDLVSELERNLRLLDSVIRYQTILLNPRVDIDSVQVNPSEVEFQRLEMEEKTEEPQLAQRLGLVEKTRKTDDKYSNIDDQVMNEVDFSDEGEGIEDSGKEYDNPSAVSDGHSHQSEESRESEPDVKHTVEPAEPANGSDSTNIEPDLSDSESDQTNMKE